MRWRASATRGKDAGGWREVISKTAQSYTNKRNPPPEECTSDLSTTEKKAQELGRANCFGRRCIAGDRRKVRRL